jgi:glutamate 5-kinase
VVDVYCDGSVVARGMVTVDVRTAREMQGRRTSDLLDGVPHELVHRDDLVVL